MPKITFLAVSGVRVYNEQLRRVGVTLPGFVERAKVIASMPSLGLLTLAAVTPDHFEIEYLECPEADPIVLDAIQADIVAISSFTAKSDVMYAISAHLRRRGITVVLGGLHCTLVSEEARQHADAIVVGEGERAWPKVLRDFEAGQLRPVYYASELEPVRLSEMPVPRYDLLDLDRYNRLPVQTSRGCPLACHFCAASRHLGPYRRKSAARVRGELETIRGLWKRPFIELADDNTFVDKKWSRELVRVLAEHDLHWFTETDISVADDPELLDLLAESGCRQLLIGLESPTRDALDGIDRANWKVKRFDGYLRAIDAIQRRGITVNGCFILGLDTHTEHVFEDVARFVERSGLLEVQVTVLTPFPGTDLYKRLDAEGRLLPDRTWAHRTLFDVCFQPRRMSVEALEGGLETLMRELYSADAVAARRRRFVDNARQRQRRTA